MLIVLYLTIFKDLDYLDVYQYKIKKIWHKSSLLNSLNK